MDKLVKISDTKAIRIEGVIVRGERYVSLRQMYRKKDQKEWQHAKQGIMLDIEKISKIRRYIKEVVEADEFVELNFDKDK